jgi:hypothetical protein
VIGERLGEGMRLIEVRALYAWAAIEPVSLSYRVSGEATPAKELIIRGRTRRR